MQHPRFKTRWGAPIFQPYKRTAEAKIFRKRLTMNLIRNYRNWRRYRETVNELSRLTNRELDDIGITRADIPNVVRRGF